MNNSKTMAQPEFEVVLTYFKHFNKRLFKIDDAFRANAFAVALGKKRHKGFPSSQEAARSLIEQELTQMQQTVHRMRKQLSSTSPALPLSEPKSKVEGENL